MDNLRQHIVQLEERITSGIPAQRQKRVQEVLQLKVALFLALTRYIVKHKNAANAEEAKAYYAEMHRWILDVCQNRIQKIRVKSQAELTQKRMQLERAKAELAQNVIKQFQSR